MWIEFMRPSDYNIVADAVNLGGNLVVWGGGAFGAAKVANAGLKKMGYSKETRTIVNAVPKTIGKVAFVGGAVAFGAAGVMLASVWSALSNRK